MALCIPLKFFVTYCVSHTVVSFRMLRSGIHQSMRNHAIAGMVATGHSLHSWYKIVKGEPVKGWQEVIVIGILNILPCAMSLLEA